MALFFCLVSLTISYAGPLGSQTFPGIKVGTVTDASTKQCIPNATVSALDDKGVLLVQSKTNPEGYYQLSILNSPKAVFIRVEKEGYLTQTKGGSLSPNRTYTINFSLTPSINHPPSIAPIRPRTIREKQRLIFRIYAYDIDKDPLTYSAANLPQGAVFDPKTRIFSWTPAYGQQGTHNITFEVTDGKLKDSKTATLIVKPNPPILSISVSRQTWQTGLLEVNKTILTTGANKIMVSNNGNGPETFELRLIDPGGWKSSILPGQETYSLSGIFCGTNDNPRELDFNQGPSNEDVIMLQAKKATNNIFAYEQSSNNAVAVPRGEARSLYLQLKTPTITQNKEEQSISLIITCQTP